MRDGEPERATVVLGVGNPLMGDDGVGLEVLERLRRRFVFDPPVELVDGGTGGVGLLPVVEDASHLLIVDAIQTGRPPGSLVVLRGPGLPRALPPKLSPHQVDLRDVLALAALRDALPRELLLVGLEPERVEFGAGLGACVSGELEALVDRVVECLSAWGHAPRQVRAVAS